MQTGSISIRFQRRVFGAVAASAAALVLLTAAGCGGGGDGNDSGRDAVGAQQLAETGHAALNDVLRSDTPPTEETLSGVHRTFSEAYAKDPDNVEAAFGYGIMEIMLAVQELTGQPVTSLGRAVNDGLGWGIRPLDAAGWTRSAAALAPLHGIGRGRQAGLLFGYPRDRVLRFRERLGNAMPAIQKAADLPGFAFVVPNFNEGAPADGDLTADQGDAQALLTLLYATRAVSGLAIAYETNTGDFNFDQPIAERFADKADGATVAPDEYLPPAPFLTLAGDGAALIASAKPDLITAADTGLAAATTLAARPSPAGHLFDTSGADFTQGRAALLIFKDALSNPYQIPGDVSVTINLNAWFTNPPPSLRAFLPTYRVRRVAGEMVLEAGPGDFPDRTLNGLLVNPPFPLFLAGARGSDPVGKLANPGVLSEGAGGLLGGLTGD